MDAIRRLYQQAVAIPMHSVETLWRDYEAWENSLNKLTVQAYHLKIF